MYTIAGTLLSDCFRSFWDDSIHATFLVTRNCLVEFFKLVETFLFVDVRGSHMFDILQALLRLTISRLKVDCGRWQKSYLKVHILQSFNIIFFFKILYINYSLFKLIYFMIYYNLGLGLLYVRSIISKHVIHF